ncbi:hypothetical protein PFISCL1PPCAC_9183, partial [Pristionchus fissidentatus]
QTDVSTCSMDEYQGLSPMRPFPPWPSMGSSSSSLSTPSPLLSDDAMNVMMASYMNSPQGRAQFHRLAASRNLFAVDSVAPAAAQIDPVEMSPFVDSPPPHYNLV